MSPPSHYLGPTFDGTYKSFDPDGLTPVERLEKSRPGFEQLITTMAPDIDARRWDALIGDDVSGRVTTLVLRSVIGQAYNAQRRPKPRTYFMAMGESLIAYDASVQTRRDYLASSAPPERALFVTDTVHTGGTVHLAQRLLDELDIPNDVASAQADPHLLAKASHAHITRHPDAKAYTISDISIMRGQPLYAGSLSRPRWRAAVGVERYGDKPIGEVERYHMARSIAGRELQKGDKIPPNPEISQLRKAIGQMAHELYVTILK